MDIAELEAEVLGIAVNEMSLNPQMFHMSTPLQHVNNVDSLDFMHLMMIYEEKYDVELDEATHARIKSLNDLVRILINEKGIQVG